MVKVEGDPFLLKKNERPNAERKERDRKGAPNRSPRGTFRDLELFKPPKD
jgi:hypothetical protein